jgi:hypothetical protein
MSGSIPLPIAIPGQLRRVGEPRSEQAEQRASEAQAREAEATYPRTVPGHDDDRHVIPPAPIVKPREAWIKPAFCTEISLTEEAHKKTKQRRTFGQHLNALVERQVRCLDDALQFLVECISFFKFFIRLTIIHPISLLQACGLLTGNSFPLSSF